MAYNEDMVEVKEDTPMLLQLLPVPVTSRQSEVQDVQVCRICFATGCCLNTMKVDKDLCQAYGSLTGLLIENDDRIPPYLCSECSQQLMHCTHFRNRTLQAHLCLLEILRKHDKITLELIKTLKESQDGQRSNNAVPNNSEHVFGPEPTQIKKENILTNEQTCQNNTHSSPHDTVLGIKKENVNIRQDGSQSDNFSVPSIYEDIMVHVGVKIERDEEYNEESCNVGEASNDNIVKDEMFDSEDLSLDILKEQMQAGLNVTEVEEPTKHKRYTRRKRKCGDKLILYDKLCCDKCPYKTISDIKMLSHLQAHALDRPNANNNISNKQEEDSKILSSYLCHICKKILSSICNLHKHMRMHSDVKPFKCDVCTKEFREKRDLQNHLRTHSGEKPFSCDLCKKSFSERSNLLRHIRIHSGVKPFSCIICRRSFNQRHHLKRHIMKKHNKV